MLENLLDQRFLPLPVLLQSAEPRLRLSQQFGGVRLAEGAPRLYLVAPALRVHPATEVVLRYLSPRVEWVLVALDERWRKHVKVVWRKRSGA